MLIGMHEEIEGKIKYMTAHDQPPSGTKAWDKLLVIIEEST